MRADRQPAAAAEVLARRPARLFLSLVLAAVVGLTTATSPAQAGKTAEDAKQKTRAQAPAAHRAEASGHKRVGIASYYAHRFSGRRMADGTPMRPESDNAASRTLPLGSKALVTNSSNGKSAMVTIRDRGPYVRGRIIDLSPRTARQLGITQQGIAKVEVLPLNLPTTQAPPSVVASSSSAEKPGPTSWWSW